MKKNTFLSLFLLLILSFITPLRSQNLSAKVLDSTSLKPVPYATVIINKKGIITNEEGRFSFPLDGTMTELDTLYISCMGYESLSRPLKEFTETSIYLSPKAIELREVIVSNKNYTADEIMDLVIENLKTNYRNDLSRKRLFHRESNFNRWTKSDFTVKKSTIDVLNQKFLDSIISTVPKVDNYYSEVLGDFYGNNDEESQKLDLLKASKLYDKSTELDAEKIEEKFNEILKANVKEGSYFKIKSGLLSFKVDADEVSELFEEEIDSTDIAAVNKELEDKKKNEEERKKNYAKWKRNRIGELIAELPIYEDSDFNFIHKSRKYEFTLKEFTYLGNDAVYVLEFKPDGSADYSGTLYVNSDDFALIQIDYANVKPVSKFNLLGISTNTYLSKGKILFEKGSQDYYSLRYFETETATAVGVKRPLKIIEKNRIVKGKNRQNELSGKMDFKFNSREKNEIIVFESEPITQTTYEAFTENNEVLPVYMPKYDPEFWKGYTIIEPNKAITNFTSASAE